MVCSTICDSVSVVCSSYTVQFSSVTLLCPTLCDPMNRSMPGLPVHHQLPYPPKPMSIELVVPSNHLILCHPLLPSIFPSIRVFSDESVLCIRWPKYWSFSFNIRWCWRWCPVNTRADLLQNGLVGSPCSPRDSRVFSNTTVQKHRFFCAQLSL